MSESESKNMEGKYVMFEQGEIKVAMYVALPKENWADFMDETKNGGATVTLITKEDYAKFHELDTKYKFPG